MLILTQLAFTELISLKYKIFINPKYVPLFILHLRWTGHVARVGEERVCIGFWWEILRKKNNWKRGVDGWIILRLIFRKWDAKAWTGLITA